MTVKISGNEQEQILQTIEMFEVIAKSNPDDYQSLNLLKDAYTKLKRSNDVQRIRIQLAEAYLRMGQTNYAMEEIEAAGKQDPKSEKVKALLANVNERMESGEDSPQPLEQSDPINLDFSNGEDNDTSLIELREKEKFGEWDVNSMPSLDIHQTDIPEGDGNEKLAEFLLNSELIRRETVEDGLQKVKAVNSEFSPDKICVSLLDEVLKHGTVEEEEDVYLHILNHTKFGFVPLDCYEVDRQILKMLPDQMTLGRLIVPFDLISRTLMVAVCNPFDVEGKNTVQSMLDYNIQWYFATPAAITKVLSDAYRITPSK